MGLKHLCCNLSLDSVIVFLSQTLHMCYILYIPCVLCMLQQLKLKMDPASCTDSSFSRLSQNRFIFLAKLSLSQLEIALYILDGSPVKNYQLHLIILILCGFHMWHAWIAIHAVLLGNDLEYGMSHLWSSKLEMGMHFSELLSPYYFLGWNCWWCYLLF